MKQKLKCNVKLILKFTNICNINVGFIQVLNYTYTLLSHDIISNILMGISHNFFFLLQGELAELDKIRKDLYSKHSLTKTHEDFSDDDLLD